jgi:hypothetical protein
MAISQEAVKCNGTDLAEQNGETVCLQAKELAQKEIFFQHSDH